MRLSVTVRNGMSGTVRDVLVDADPDTPFSEVLPGLVNATQDGAGDIHPNFAGRVAAWVAGRQVEATETLREVGLRPGVDVALSEPTGTAAGLPAGVVEVRVVSGPGAGRVRRLGLGEHAIGSGAQGMSLPDVLLPSDALVIRVTAEATVEIVDVGLDVRIDGRDPGSPDPEHDQVDATAIEFLPDEALTRKERRRRKRQRRRERRRTRRVGTQAQGDEAPASGSMPWPAGADLRIGATLLEWHPVWVPDADTSPSEDVLGIDFNRPPRLLPPSTDDTFVLPAEPRKPRRVEFPWPMMLAPVVLGVAMALMFGSPRFLMFAALMPLMLVFNMVARKRGTARDYREQVIEFRNDTLSSRRRIARAQRLHREARKRDCPDPANLLLQAVGPGLRLWCRRPSDPDYLELRIGVADRPSPIEVRDRNLKETDEPTPPDVLGDLPVSLPLGELGIVGVTGDPNGQDALVRWLVGQAAVLHAPDDLSVVVLTSTDRRWQWDWLRWLPHSRRPGEPLGAAVGNDQDSIGRRLAELGQLIAQRAATGSTSSRGPGPRPDVLVVLDGARRLRALPGLVGLLRDGPAQGVHVVCVDDDVRSLPEECRAILEVREDLVEWRRTGSEAVARIRPDLVEAVWVERVARALAPLRDTTPDVESANLPASARLLECIGLEDPTPELVARRWGSRAQTEVVIGEGFDGPFRLDLRRDGPHALIAGTTGSGKSELLQTIVASLAVANSPEQLTFVLVDYKGGSAFKDCNDLPHTVGMVTDLDTHLVERALTSLGAELKRREHLLAGPGAKDLEDYWALQRNDPELPTIPRLAIVIDEFASLKAELPEFVNGLVTIAQRGRSLGIHLVLATQRPSGVISNDIRANTNLRIALRMTDEAESKDVIDAAESATIRPDQPGRGYARLGHSSLLPFQSGRVGGARPELAAVEGRPGPLVWPVPWERLGHPAPARPKPAEQETDEGETDLSVLVEAIRGANAVRGIAPQHSPWLPELPALVTAEELGTPEPADERVLGWRTRWALEDHPADQAQRPREFVLGSSGHLYVIGGPRSGRSTALRTLAAGLAQQASSRDLHLYGLDCGNGALLPLGALPHAGPIVQRSETERASRLLERLSEEIKRRQGVLGAQGYADIDEQRAAASAEERLPYVLFLLDRWEGFLSDLAEVDLGSLNEQVMGILREGASVGIQVVVSGDRSLLSGRVSSLVEHRLVLRLPDRSDYTAAGLKTRDVPDAMPDGRGLWADSGVETQVAVLTEDAAGAAQGAWVRELADRLRREEQTDDNVSEMLRPFQLAALPAEVDAVPLLHAPDPLPPGHVAVGLGGDDLVLQSLDASRTPVVIGGRGRTGRTSALRFVAAHATALGRAVLAFAPHANALSDQLGTQAFVGLEHELQDLVERVRAVPEGGVVLIDDAERYKAAPFTAVFTALVQQSAERHVSVVVAGADAELNAGFNGWLTDARRGRKGVLLSPQEGIQGDLYGARIERTSLVARIHPGRGVLFPGDGDQLRIQVPHLP